MKTLTMNLPLFVDIPRKTKAPRRMHLSLNNYRNWHPMVESQVKHIFEDLVREQIMASGSSFKFDGPVSVSHTMFAKDENRDLENFCPIIAKYCNDAVVSMGILRNDKVKDITQATYRWGGIDRVNPRMVVIYQET